MLKAMIVDWDVDCWTEWLLNGSWLMDGMLIVEMNNCWMELSLLNGMIVEWKVDCWIECLFEWNDCKIEWWLLIQTIVEYIVDCWV